MKISSSQNDKMVDGEIRGRRRDGDDGNMRLLSYQPPLHERLGEEEMRRRQRQKSSKIKHTM